MPWCPICQQEYQPEAKRCPRIARQTMPPECQNAGRNLPDTVDKHQNDAGKEKIAEG